jgi:thiamine biosynthesis lipoprotein
VNASRRALGAGALGLALPGPARGAAPLVWRERVMLALGTRTWLRAAHADFATVERALAEAAAAVAAVDAALSLFRPDSALARLNRDGEVHEPPRPLVAALRLARRAASASGGTFDPSVQPLWRTWYEAHLRGDVPSAREVAAAQARRGFAAVVIDERHVRLPHRDMALTLNGIGQGFAADEARRALLSHGIEHALVDTGEWWPIGRSEQAGPWRLGVARPRAGAAAVADGGPGPSPLPRLLATVLADGRAVACSADDMLPFTADRREHHILDPRSGHSPPRLAMVVVLASSAAWADAMTKPLMMGSAEAALALAPRLGCDVLAVEKSGRWRATGGVRLA